tara:strand:+ start:686 stop:874 length:189 start_codon:yes stop_codon:yes gene_type:complete
MIAYLNKIVRKIPTNAMIERESKTGSFFMIPLLQKSVSSTIIYFPFLKTMLQELRFLFFLTR